MNIAKSLVFIVATSEMSGQAAAAAEAVRYTYDALGRLTIEQHTSGASTVVTTTTEFDSAGNRTTAVVAGAARSAVGAAVIRLRHKVIVITQ